LSLVCAADVAYASRCQTQPCALGHHCPDNDTERDTVNAWSIHSFTYPQIEKWTSLGYV